MTALFFQTALILLGSYFAGTFLGCMLRRAFGRAEAPVRVDVKPAVTTAAARPVETVQRQPAPSPTVTPPVRRPDPEPVAPRIETIQRPQTTSTATAPKAAQFERALTAAPERKPDPVAPTVTTTAAVASAAAAATVATAAAVRPQTTVTAPPPPAEPVTVEPPKSVQQPIVAKPVEPVKVEPIKVEPPKPAPQPVVVKPVEPIKVEPPKPAPEPVVVKPVEPVKVEPVKVEPIKVEPPKPAPDQIILPAASSGAGPSSVAATIAPPSATPLPADDLTLLRAIDPQLQARLNQLGVRRFADVAGWTTTDVDRINTALGMKGRIEHENWIEQAQILAKGGETFYSRRKLRGEIQTATPTAHEGVRAEPPVVVAPPPAMPAAVVAPPAPVAPTPVVVPSAPAVSAPAVVSGAAAAAAAAVKAATMPPRVEERAAFAEPAPAVSVATPRVEVAPASSMSAAAAAASVVKEMVLPTDAKLESARPAQAITRDALQRLAGVNAEVEKLLNVQGITRFAQIAGWTPADVMRFDRLLGHEGRISREKWIEQAQVLARGGETAYSRDFDHRSREALQDTARPLRTGDAITQASAPAPAPVNVAPVAPVAAPPAASASDTTSVLAAAAAAAAAVARPVVSAEAPSATAAAVAPAATSTAVHSAAALAASVAAAAASTATDAKASIAEAARSTATDISGMRSVKSEAFRPADAAPAAGSIAAIAANVLPNRARTGAPDDLKRIRGVGVLIEKKLNSMGVTSYDQIANWTNADIEKVSHMLDFKGRIERENWVEQARILSSGGQTEFSRRVDRGDVETSKSRVE
jgi:predicted flap endonuclease-1-like 5' DNA nuclease